MNFACIDENARVSSAAPKRFRPLGQPRNTEVMEKRRARSANPTLVSRNLERQDVEQVSKPEIKQAEQVPKSEEKQDEQVTSEHEEQQDEHVFEPEESPEVSESDGKQADEISGEVQKQQPEVDIAKTDEDDLSLGTLPLYYRSLFVRF